MSIFGTPVTAFGGARSAGSVSTSGGGVNTAIGDLLIVGVGWSDSGTCSGVSDLAGNILAPLTSRTEGSFEDAGFMQLFWCIATAANAANVFTAAFSSGTNNYSTIVLWDVPISGGTPTLDLDIASSGSGNGTTASFSTSSSDEFVAYFALDGFGSGGYAAASPYTLDSASYGTFSGAAHGTFTSTQSGITAGFSSHPGIAYAIAAAFSGGGGGGGGAAAQPVVCVMQ